MKIKKCFSIVFLGFFFAGSLNDSLINLFNQDKYLAFLSLTEEILEQDQSQNDMFFKRASEAAFNLDELDKSITFLKKAIAVKDKKEYREEWDKIVTMRKDIEIALKMYTEENKYDDSILQLLKLKEKYPGCGLLDYNIGKINQQESIFDEALKYFKMSISVNPYREKYQKSFNYILGQYIIEGDEYAGMRDFDSANEKYSYTLNYMPDNSVVLFKIAKTNYFLKNYNETIKHLTKLIKIDSSHFQGFKLLGDAYKKESDYDAALANYLQSLEVNPNYEKAYLSAGQIYYSNGDFNKAIEYFETAISKKNNYSKAYEMIGLINENLENFTQAIYYFEETIKYDRRNYKTMSRLASVYNSISNFELAKKHSNNCIKLKRNYAPAYYELGLSEKGLGNRIAAIDAFEKASKDSRWRKAAKYEIDQIKAEL